MLGGARARNRTALAGVLLLLASVVPALVGPAHAAPEDPSAGRTVLVLDSSGSMKEGAGGGRTKIEAAREALRDVVDGLDDEAEVGLRVFGATVFSRTDPGSCADTQLVVGPGTDNRKDLLAAIDDYRPYGETPIPAALRAAADDLGDEGTRSIVLVSDGESTCDPDPCTVAAELAGDGIDLRIDVVGLSVSGRARSQLECIAERGKGTYFDADDAADIEATLTRVARRAVQPFTIGGTPVAGGTETAPAPLAPGRWVAQVGQEEQSFSYERTEPGTTLRVSAYTQGERSTNDTVRVEIFDPEGRRCAGEHAMRILDTRSVSGTRATAGPAEKCAEAGIHRVVVSRGYLADQAVPVGVLVTEEPATTEVPEAAGALRVADVDVPAPDFAGTPRPVVGSPSFDRAPELGAGTWKDTVVPGEALVYRVRLEHGQSAAVGVRFEAGTAEHREAFGIAAPMARVVVHDPMMAAVGHPDAADVTQPVGGREEVVLSTATAPVGPAPGARGGQFSGGADMTLAGDHYLVVAVKKDQGLELPFEIDLRIDGDPGVGPAYADGATWSVQEQLSPSGADGDNATSEPGEGDGPEGVEGRGEQARADEKADDDGVASWPFVAVGVLVLVAGAAAVLGLRRPRSSI